MPTSSNFCGMEKGQEMKSATNYKSHDDSNDGGKEQVRDLGIMMSNTTTLLFILENILVKRSETKWDGC